MQVKESTGRKAVSPLAPPRETAVRRIERVFVISLWLVLVVYSAYQYYLHSTHLARWDLLFITGVLTLQVGLRAARGIPAKMLATVTRLADRKALCLGDDSVQGFWTELETTTDLWAHRAGLAVMGILVAAYVGRVVFFIISYFQRLGETEVPQSSSVLTGPIPVAVEATGLVVISLLGGYCVGRQLGRFILYGRLRRLFEERGWDLKVLPGHPDDTAGLKPVGDFFFLQAAVAALPALFLAVWIVLMPRSSGWRQPYVWMLPFALAAELLAFLWPMWAFHREMRRQKQTLLKQADGLSQQMAEIKAGLARPESDPERKVLKDRLDSLTEQYWSIENMPTWPVAPTTRRRFTLSNVPLFFPLITEFVSLSGIWERLLDLLKNLFTASAG